MLAKCVTVSMGAATALVVLVSAGCGKHGDSAAWWQGEQERLELSQNLALKEYRFQQCGSSQVGELEKFRISNKEGKRRLQDLTKRRDGLGDDVGSLEQRLASLEKEIIDNQRRNAVGQKFKVLSSTSGREYQDVAIMSVDDSGVAIRHADGSARLRYEDLDQKQREFFGLEESSAMAAVEEEGRQALAYEQWIDSGLAVTRDKEARSTQLAKLETERAQRTRALVASHQVTAESNRALAQPARSFGGYSSSYSGSYSSYRTSRPSYRYVYYYTPYSSYGSCNSYYRNPRTGPKTDYSQSFSNTTIPSIP